MSKENKEKLYIIGGSGFIGKNMVRRLHGRYDILVFDKYIDEAYFSTYPDVKYTRMELDKEQIPAEYETPDYIINLASIVTAERDMGLFDAMIQSNLKVLLNLYERFKDDSVLKLFIQFGSCEEYGEVPSPYVETMREEPNSPYALVKQLTTNTAIMLHRNYGFPIAVVRPGNLFGPLQNKSKFIPYVIDQLKANQPLNVTPCEQKRDFIYVDDFVDALSNLLVNPHKFNGEIVNLGSGCSISLREVIELCRLAISSHSEVNYGAIPYRENEVMELSCSMEKYNSIVGSQVFINVKERIYEMAKQSNVL